MNLYSSNSDLVVDYNILLVEDNHGDAFIVREYLEEHLSHFEMLHVHSGQEAVTALTSEQHSFNVILLDLSLPDMRGADLLKIILDHSRQIPVVVLTGNEDNSFSVKSLELGVCDYLKKGDFNAFALYRSVIYAVERGRLQSEMHQLNSKLQAAINRAKLGYWSYDVASGTFLLSKELQTMLDINPPANQCNFSTFMDLLGSIDHHQFEIDFHKSISQKYPLEMEIESLMHGETHRIWYMKGECEFNQQGNVKSFEGIMQDITSQSTQEEHRNLLESVITHAKDAVIITEGENIDAPGPVILYVNKAFTALTGYRPHEVMGLSPRMLQGPETDRVQLEILKKAMLNLEPCQIEVLNYHKNGSAYWVEMSVVPILNKAGRCTHFISIERDVTERKRSEQFMMELNENLEMQVEERTKELKTAHHLLRYHYTELKDSITYARHMQRAVLRSEQDLAKLFTNSFVFSKARDVVSGDFMWCHQVNEHVSIVALVDCTGHGVPGALLSMIAHRLLEQSVYIASNEEPHLIINYVHNELTKIFSRRNDDYKHSDGMDVALCVFDKRKHTVKFCGARQDIYVVSEGKISNIRGSKFTIGGSDLYQVHDVIGTTQISLDENGIVFMSSDGFTDQFGGPKKKKMLKKPLMAKLVENAHLDLATQKFEIEKFFSEWRGVNEQTDDVLLLAVKPFG